MDPSAVMQELADLVDTIQGLRVQGFPAETVSAPAAVVTYPADQQYDITAGNGGSRMNPAVVVLVGNVYKKTTRQAIGEYAAPSGPKSIKATLESRSAGEYETFDDIRVTGVTYDVVQIGAVEYLAATFTCDIIGAGE